jgi:UDP-2,4-diacetamido-2,4,6-trideoxy-beta-L-altropyranose hydrolase
MIGNSRGRGNQVSPCVMRKAGKGEKWKVNDQLLAPGASPTRTAPGPLVIRADADPRLGTGHVMRGLALAQAWRAAGGRATLVGCLPGAGGSARSPRPAGGRSYGRSGELGDGGTSLAERVRQAGVVFEPLDHPHPHPADLSATLDWLSAARAKADKADVLWLVLDGYHFDAAYQRAVRQTGCRLMVVDDTAHLPRYDADLVLNQNLGADRLPYVCDEEATLLFGPRYALLRPEFHCHGTAPQAEQESASMRPSSIINHPSPTTSATAKRILVTLGGSDPENVTRLVIRALGQVDVPGLEARIVVGPANPHVDSLRAELGPGSRNVQLLTQVVDMPELMAWADVAISAAGSTCWELALVGLPALITVVADNQQLTADALAEAGAAVHLGPSGQLTVERIARQLSSLCRDPKRRARQSEAGRRLVDARGAQRVVAVMRALDGPIPDHELSLRPVVAGDMRAVWRLATAPSARQNSLSPEPIPWATHVRWFHQKLASPDTRMWALDFHRLLVGQIRYDRIEAETALVSFSVPAAFRGRGLGTKLLELTRERAAKQLGVSRLRAEVRADNLPSLRIVRHAGFTHVGSKRALGREFHVFQGKETTDEHG